MTIETLFEKSNFVPNDPQRNAIFHEDGPLLITAGPGSGKTRVLLWRTVNLIVFREVPPSEIFLSTFTEKAALQLRDGLRSLLGLASNETGKPYDITEMSIGTVHSLCRKLLTDRRFADNQERRRTPVLMDELGQYFHLYDRSYWKTLLKAGGFDDEEAGQRAINAWASDRDSYSRHEAVVNTIAFFNRLSEEDCGLPINVPAPSADSERQADGETLQALLKMYERYRADLSAEAAVESVDFSTLQQTAYRSFLATEASKSVFRHVIIDEYQDTNSIQEKLFFRLAAGHKNICVVGDDDQALYRFRGATVENLVDFENRCQTYLGCRPRRVDLGTNYRSKKRIVDLCTRFINSADWSARDGSGVSYRIADKRISAAREGDEPAIIASNKAKAEDVYAEIACFIRALKENGAITDFNQVAFLFPSMKGWGGMNTRVHGFMEAFAKEGIPYYAPRAGRFLEVEESLNFFGLCMEVFGRPEHRERGKASAGFRSFQDWLASCQDRATRLKKEDSALAQFLQDRKAEVEQAGADYESLNAWCAERSIDPGAPVEIGFPQIVARSLKLSLRVQKALQSHQLNESIRSRINQKRPYTVRYLLNRVTALDWGVLDLFYQLGGFSCFLDAYRLAEKGEDEGPICNLGLITQYLARFDDEYGPILTGQMLAGKTFVNLFFSSYLYALFRLEESEYENVDDPFPKGRVPFLTIHQAKGLEFPVVVLGSVYRESRDASKIERTVRTLLDRKGEPLDRIDEFDTMRMFYVALSRARNLVVLPRYTHGKAAHPAFATILESGTIPPLASLDLSTLPKGETSSDEFGKTYTYTGDYLPYLRCPRNYMAFGKYGFIPSRGQSMFFGRLVHETIEDLHHFVMALGVRLHNMNDEEIEFHIHEIFDENYDFLKAEGGDMVTDFVKNEAFSQVLQYWKRNRALIDKITESEVKLTLPGLKTPRKDIPYNLEGVVDIVREGEETWMYDIKTHERAAIESNLDSYKAQLNVYAYIWRGLRGNKLDNTAIISTPLPPALKAAIKSGDEAWIARERAAWDPIIPLGYSEDEVERMIKDFGAVVESIEDHVFTPPPTERLTSKEGRDRNIFAVRVCRNCDIRYSCASFRDYVKSSDRGNQGFRRYLDDYGTEIAPEAFIEGNLRDDV